MIGYAAALLATAALFTIFGVLIYKGKTELIHDYHQTKVKDKVGYGKAMGKVMGLMAGTMAISGVIALFGESIMWVALAELVVGFGVSFIAIFRVQKKYNGGLF